MRIDKYLSGLGFGSRKDVKKMIKQGRVSVDGAAVATPEAAVDPNRSRVCVDGKETVYREFAYVMLNKPKGYVSATEDGRYPTVCELAPAELAHMSLFPVGRLDVDTEGLCLLTNDGALAHRLLSPKKHVPKTYIAELSAPAEEEDVRLFASGVKLDDGYVCKPAELEILENNSARVVIYEGKYHQVKRMFAAVGKRVTALKRVKIGGLGLDESLAVGGARELTSDEIALLETFENETGDNINA